MSDYKKIRKLGSGFFGEVWLTYDLALDENRAVKYVTESRISDPTDFYKEPRFLKELRHSYIVRVEDAGKTKEGTLYIAMEYLERGSLEDIFKNGPVFLRKAKVIICGVCWALEYAHHEKGVIHCDIKPANILLGDDGKAKLSDFGLATHIPEGGSAPFEKVYLAHIAPEAYTRREMNVLTDVYALGVTAYRLINGDSYLPEIDTREELIDRIMEGKYPDRQRYRPCVPTQVRRVVNKAMNIDPSKRFQCASQFRLALEAIDLRCSWGWDYRGRSVIYRTKIRKKGRSTMVKVIVKLKEDGKFHIKTTKKFPSGIEQKVHKDNLSGLTKPQMRSSLRKILCRYVLEGK